MPQNLYQQPYTDNFQQPEQARARLMPYGQVIAAWVNGPQMATDMFVEPNKIAFMVDEQNNKIYVKRADQIGRQSPLATYDFVEPPPEKPAVDLSGYVTKEQLSDFVTRFDSLEDKINGLFESLAAPKRRARKDDDNDEYRF